MLPRLRQSMVFRRGAVWDDPNEIDLAMFSVAETGEMARAAASARICCKPPERK